MGIYEHIALVKRLTAEVEAHPMCLRLETTREACIVYFPAGDLPVQGVRASVAAGKARALRRVLAAMERHWIESYP